MDRKYIYGIILSNEESSFGLIGLGDEAREVYTIVNKDLSCIISDYHGQEFQAMAKYELIRCLMTHQAVIEEVMKRHSVLPVKFGTVLEGSAKVERFLEQGYAQLKEALDRIWDKVEIEIAATWNLSNVFQELGNEEEIVRLKETITARRVEETIEQRIQLGKAVKELLDRRRDSYQNRMIDFLKDMALDMQPNALLSDEMVLNVAFLIGRAKEEDFISRVRELNGLFHDEIDFRVIGPLPPYSFSTVEVVSPSANKLEEAKLLLGLGEAVSEADVKEAYRRLVTKIHPDCNRGDQQAEPRFAKLHDASALLLAYCRGRGDGRHIGKKRYPLTPSVIEDTFLISVKRSAAREGQEVAALAI